MHILRDTLSLEFVIYQYIRLTSDYKPTLTVSYELLGPGIAEIDAGLYLANWHSELSANSVDSAQRPGEASPFVDPLVCQWIIRPGLCVNMHLTPSASSSQVRAPSRARHSG